MGFHLCNGVVLHGRRLGDAGKPLLVFANSLGTDARIWDDVIPPLLDRYGVLLHDQRGHGLSATPDGPYRIADLAADLVALIDAIGTRRFALVGLSVGGMVAQAVAAAHPDRVAALVLCDTGTRIGEPATWAMRIAAVDSRGLEAVASSVLERWFTPAYRARETVAMQGWHAMLTRQPAAGYASTCAAIRDADLRPDCAAIRAPTLCLVGDQDLATPPALVRELADRIAGARFSTIAESGHLPCIEQPAALAAMIAGHCEAAGLR